MVLRWKRRGRVGSRQTKTLKFDYKRKFNNSIRENLTSEIFFLDKEMKISSFEASLMENIKFSKKSNQTLKSEHHS